MVTAEELEAGKALDATRFKPVVAEQVAGILNQGGPTSMEAAQVAKFQVGDAVVINNQHPAHHTRMPRYIRGRKGVIVLHHGAHVFPDSSAVSGEKQPAHL